MDVSLAYTKEREGKNIQYPTRNNQYPRKREEQLAVGRLLRQGFRLRDAYGGQVEHPTGEGGVRVVTFRRCWPHYLYFSWGMLLGLGREIRDVDVVHVHSNWTFPVWWGCWCALRAKKILVMSPRGCLDPIRLKHSAWKKRLAGWMDRWFLNRASVIHATCEAEKEWVRDFLNIRLREYDSGGQAENAENIEHRTLNVEHPIRKMPRIVVIPNGIGDRLCWELRRSREVG
jgi:glycosyltransferase involved in cell wall biosynthesis